MINRTNIVLATAALFGALVVNAAAGELILPSSTLSGTGSVPITFKLPLGLTGKGTLQVRWTDSLDRLVEDGTVPIELTDETEIRFSIDLSRAIAMKNDLHAHLSLDGADARGKAGHHEEDADASFVFRPAEHRLERLRHHHVATVSRPSLFRRWRNSESTDLR